MYNLKKKIYTDGTVQLQIFPYPVTSTTKKQFKCKSWELRYNVVRSSTFYYPRQNKGFIPLNKKCVISSRYVPTTKIINKKSEAYYKRDDMALFEKQYHYWNSVRRSARRTKEKIYDICRNNEWTYFLTFTFSPDKANRYDYKECSFKMSKWLNYMRKESKKMGYNLQYIVVPEMHKDGAFHFHGLFKNCGALRMVFSGLYDKKKRRIFNVGKYYYGWTTATLVSDSIKASNYITKYITKELCGVARGKKRYWASRGLDIPKEETYQIEWGNIVRDTLLSCDVTYHKDLEIDTFFKTGVHQKAVITYIEYTDSVECEKVLSHFMLA